MDVSGRPITIYLDEATITLLDRYMRSEQVSRSLAVRMIVDAFYRGGGPDAQ